MSRDSGWRGRYIQDADHAPITVAHAHEGGSSLSGRRLPASSRICSGVMPRVAAATSGMMTLHARFGEDAAAVPPRADPPRKPLPLTEIGVGRGWGEGGGGGGGGPG